MSEALTTVTGSAGQLANQTEGMQLSAEELELLYGASWENVDAKAEIQISRLGIMQMSSPEVSAGKKGYEAGQIFDTITREVLSVKMKPQWLVDQGVPPDELSTLHCLPILVVCKLPVEFGMWTTMQQRLADPNLPKLLWKTIDKNDPRVQEGVWASRGGTWGTKARPETMGKKPPVTDCINYLVQPLRPDYQARCSYRIASFSRTSAFCGKQVTGFINDKRIALQPFWAEVVWLYTDKDKHEETGTYYQFFRMAVGKPLAQVNPQIARSCMKMATELANKETGRTLQEELLRIAVDDDGQIEVPNNEQPNTVDAAARPADNAGPAFQASSDPFDGK